MSILNNILSYVALRNAKLDYIETTSTDYIFHLEKYQLPKTIVDKNMNITHILHPKGYSDQNNLDEITIKKLGEEITQIITQYVISNR